MFGLGKRDAEWHGLQCIADMSTAEYMAAKTQAQAQVPWASQVDYGYYTVYFGCATVGLALLKHLYYSYRDFAYKTNRSSNGITSFVDILTAYFRFFGYKQVPAKISYFSSLPPSVGSSLYLMASTLFLGLYCFVPHFWYRGCRGFGSPPLAVRAGIMATALTPFVYILSGKSNMITLFTGISYEKLNYLHQYVGVAALVLSIVHTVPFFWQALHEGGPSRLAYFFQTNFYFYSGVPPLAFLVFLCVFSKSFVRKHFYECFLQCHWIFGVLYFATLLWHVWKQLGTDNYMWAALAFWFSQLIYRALVKTCFRPSALFMRPRVGQLAKLKDSNAYQVVVSNVKDLMWKPGQHVFLRFVGSKILHNHPFSICSLPTGNETELKFIIVPKKGLTGELYQELDDFVVSKKKVFVDGPYGGSSRDINSFDKVVLVTTGTGVTATLPFLTQIARRQAAENNCITQEVHFVWIVSNLESINWVRHELDEAIENGGDAVAIDIFVCSPAYDGNVVESDHQRVIEKPDQFDEEMVESKTPTITNNKINIHYRKPNVYELMLEFKFTLKQRNMFVSSGSDSMKFDVSRAVSSFQPLVFNSDVYGSNIEEVYLHTENFGW